MTSQSEAWIAALGLSPERAVVEASGIEGLGGGQDVAIFDPTRTFRLLLTRNLPRPPALGTLADVGVIMVNPSTADAHRDDATIRNLRGLTARLMPRIGSLVVGNAYGLMSTDPRALRTAPDPEGPDNRRVLSWICRSCAHVIVAWGASFPVPDDLVEHLIRERAAIGRGLLCFGTTKDGHPRHPLYLPRNSPLLDWRSALAPRRARGYADGGDTDT